MDLREKWINVNVTNDRSGPTVDRCKSSLITPPSTSRMTGMCCDRPDEKRVWCCDFLSLNRQDWEQSTLFLNYDLHLCSVRFGASWFSDRLKLNRRVVMVLRQNGLVIRPPHSLGNDTSTIQSFTIQSVLHLAKNIFKRHRFPPKTILLAVRWNCRYPLS